MNVSFKESVRVLYNNVLYRFIITDDVDNYYKVLDLEDGVCENVKKVDVLNCGISIYKPSNTNILKIISKDYECMAMVAVDKNHGLGVNLSHFHLVQRYISDVDVTVPTEVIGLKVLSVFKIFSQCSSYNVMPFNSFNISLDCMYCNSIRKLMSDLGAETIALNIHRLGNEVDVKDFASRNSQVRNLKIINKSGSSIAIMNGDILSGTELEYLDITGVRLMNDLHPVGYNRLKMIVTDDIDIAIYWAKLQAVGLSNTVLFITEDAYKYCKQHIKDTFEMYGSDALYVQDVLCVKEITKKVMLSYVMRSSGGVLVPYKLL